MKYRISISMILPLLFVACAKQQPDQPPGTAAITNLKTGIHVAQVAATETRDVLPELMTSADVGDRATANVVVDNIDKGLTALDKAIAPYTSFDASNQQEIKRAVQSFLDLLAQLQRDQVTHIKNSRLQSRINQGIKLASGALSLWNPPSV